MAATSATRCRPGGGGELVTIAYGRDDIGTTVSAFMPVSLDPPLVLVSLIGDFGPAEGAEQAVAASVTVRRDSAVVRGRGSWPASSLPPTDRSARLILVACRTFAELIPARLSRLAGLPPWDARSPAASRPTTSC